MYISLKDYFKSYKVDDTLYIYNYLSASKIYDIYFICIMYFTRIYYANLILLITFLQFQFLYSYFKNENIDILMLIFVLCIYGIVAIYFDLFSHTIYLTLLEK